MKKIKYSFILLATTFFASSQVLLPTPETAFEPQHHFNPEVISSKNVKKIVFEIVDKKDYEEVVNKHLVETYEFDSGGQLTRHYFTNVVKTIEKQTTVSVPRGKRKGYHTYVQTHNEYLYDTTSTSYFYNDKRRLSLKRYHDGAMYYESRYYRYDSLGNLTKELRYRETNNSNDKSVFILGGQLLLSEDSFQYKKYESGQLHCFLLNNENRPYKQIISNYDSLGRKTRMNEFYTTAAWIKQESEFTYINGKMAMALFKGNANKEISIRITYDYDQYNELLTEKQFRNDVLQKEISYITDSHNHLLNSLVIRDHVNKSMRIIKLKYEFESVSRKGN